MSLGWITQSALLPGKAKEIKIESNSLVDLKAKILEEKSKINKKKEGQFVEPESNGANSNKKKNDLFKDKKQNQGLQQRLLRDEEDADQIQIQAKLDPRQIEFKLAEKAQKYDELSMDKKAFEKGKSLLVDFEKKRWDKIDSDKSNGKSSTRDKDQDYVSQMMTQHDIMQRERLQWEEETKKQIEASENGQNYAQLNSASALMSSQSMPLVKQRWDNILTNKEKEQLPEVIKDKERQRELQLLAKRRRDDDREKRMLKIEELKKRQKTQQ